jgi:hypothetical protein
MTETTTETAFNPVRGSTLYTADGELHLVPQFRNYLLNPPDAIDFHVSGLGPRTSKPSGWFSPSTHPTWPLRDLVMYAIDPASAPAQVFPDETRISMFWGTVFHVVSNRMFQDMGILVPPPEKECPLCHRKRGYKLGADTCNEHAVFDHGLRRRGHIDDVVKLARLGTVPVDVKTCSAMAIKWINNHDPGPFIEGKTPLKAKYYGQAQEYIDLYGAEMLMFLFCSIGAPWEMKEVIIYRDQPYIDALKAKYTLARELASRGQIPAP